MTNRGTRRFDKVLGAALAWAVAAVPAAGEGVSPCALDGMFAGSSMSGCAGSAAVPAFSAAGLAGEGGGVPAVEGVPVPGPQPPLAQAPSAASLPEGSFKGTTPLAQGPDVMALLLRKDPANAEAYYAVLAEYDRVSGTGVIERLAITRWIPRMYAYRVEKTGELAYAMRRLRVSSTGGIEVDSAAVPDTLVLAGPGTLDGAVLTRYDGDAGAVAETIKFKGKVGSTWENYVPGKFFGSTDRTGDDYFKDDVNLVLSKDGGADFSQAEIQGRFEVSERLPGMFTFSAKSPENMGIEKVVTRIGVFVDIVNWKPLFNTNELLLINPDDAKDVGFYYERT